ncbi:hypothetical protein PM082_020690 [Marasmius tenuissimus]|nr:hypothetical protein PM082_020690 [Marasmius tenuissimus]
MRLRLESSPPLPHLKAWFSSSQLQCKPGTYSSQHKSQPAKIIDLKKSICATVKPLIEGGFRTEKIILELDGFELLDDLNVEELIRDGDLVVLGLKELAEEQNLETPITQSPERLGKKRKLGAEIPKLHQSEPSRKRRKQQSLSSSVSSTASSEASSSSDPSSSESDSSSSSDDSDDSDSDTSDSDASGSSSSSSAPSQAPTKPKKHSQNTITNASQKWIATEKHVPPGQGSAQTRKRNMRRKLKRQHDVAAARGEEFAPPSHAPKGLSDANIAPLGIRPVQETTQPERPQNDSTQMVVAFEPQLAQLPSQPSIDPSRDADLNISMFSLGNKNKKKGFKRQALSFPSVAGKIIFDAAEGTGNLASSTQFPESSTSAGSQEPVLPFATAPIPQTRPRLVPPSEKEALGLLPGNVFVSSVDVEEGLEKKKKKKRHQANSDVDEYSYVGSSSTTTKDSHGYVSCQREEEEVVDTLNYGDGGEESLKETSGEKTEEEAKSRLLWTIAEQSFDALLPVSKDVKLEEAVHSGVVIGWKGLALNPTTYSPEILLHLASVLSTSPTGALIRKIVRPEWEEYVEPEEDENVGWERAVEEGWRVIKS